MSWRQHCIKPQSQQTATDNRSTGKARLEQDVAGVEVAMADALCVHVQHAGRDVREHRHLRAPPPRQPRRREGAERDRISQRAAIAELLQNQDGTVKGEV